MTRILHVCETLGGGPASYFEEIAPAQVDRFGTGSIRFLVPRTADSQAGRLPDGVVAWFEPTRRTPIDLMRLRRIIRRAVADFAPDIVHLHSTFAGLVGRLGVLPGRPRIVYCAHGWAFSQDIAPAKRRVYAAVEARLARATDAIVNISGYDAGEARRYGVPADRQVTIRNGISAAPPTTEARSPLVARPNAINLLFVGRHDRQKGLDILLAAMAAIRRTDVHLHVLGEAVVGPAQAVADQANVTFLGWQERRAAMAAMAACDALVVPSRWEGFGLVVAEAQRAGTPVLVSGKGALPEQVREGVNGHIVHENTPEAWAALIDGLDARRLAEQGRAASAFFAEELTADRMNADIAALYARLLGERSCA